jgi:hypothetical protein
VLTIQMPDGHEAKHKRRRWQALGYIAAGLLVITSVFVAYGTQLWWLPPLVEAWWMWAVITGDWEA